MKRRGSNRRRRAFGAHDLLRFASELQHATSFSELLLIAEKEVRQAVGYQHAWFMVAEDEDLSLLRLIAVTGKNQEAVWAVAPVLEVRGDAFLEELTRSVKPVVVVDARVDPRTNKEMVEKLGNRTMINVPLRLVDKPFGLFGVGTFGEEGCRAPSARELEYLVGMANQLAVAASRIRLQEVERLAVERQQVMERQLVQAQRLESLGLLAGGVAHDFNNLLTVIIASASLAHDAVPEGEVRRELQSALAAAGRAKELTSQLLTLSRSQPLDVKPVNLREQLSRVVELSRRVLPETIDVELKVSGYRLGTEGDSSQLDQVLLNLLINARDAMPQGGRIVIRLDREAVAESSVSGLSPGSYAVVSVTDNGLGMSPAIRDRVFEPFFTTKGPTKGTGLGLAVSYGIVQQHGGIIICSSEEGVGTTFRLYFPLAVPGVTLAPPPQARPAVGNEHVLLAEDDPLLRKVTQRMLQQAGYQVTAVCDAGAACDLAKSESVELVLMDVMMPGMTCADAVANLRQQRHGLPIVLTSGYSADVNIRELVRSIENPLLRKPFTPDELLMAVRSALDRVKARQWRQGSLSLVPMAG